jgi:hypothetical protein
MYVHRNTYPPIEDALIPNPCTGRGPVLYRSFLSIKHKNVFCIYCKKLLKLFVLESPCVSFLNFMNTLKKFDFEADLMT